MIRVIIVLILALLISSCSTSSKNMSEKSVQDEALEVAQSMDSKDARAYEAIDRDFRAKKYEAVLNETQVFLKKYPNSKFLEQAYHLRGLSSIALKKYGDALAQLKKTLDIAGARADRNEKLIAMVTYNMAYVYFEMNQLEQASVTLDRLHIEEFDSPNKARAYILKSKINRIQQENKEAVKNILYAIRFSQADSAQQKSLLNFLDDVLESVDNIDYLKRVLSEFEDDNGADRLLFKIGDYEFKTKAREASEDYFNTLIKKFPSSPYYQPAVERMKVAERISDVSSKKIGVIFTLSGKFSRFGYRALHGVQLATNIFKGSAESDPVSLVVMDDEGDVEKALQAIDELYYKHHVVAVIGPLSSKLVDPLSKRANELGLPLLSIAQKEPEVAGNYAFSAGLTSVSQVQQLVRYARDVRGYQNFSIVAPANKFGNEYAQSFWDEVELSGGLVKGYETYADDETDFRSHVDRMVGLANIDARKKETDELSVLKDAALQQSTKKRDKRIDQMFRLKPIVDFQAVFIPDEPKMLGQILPTFAYRDVDKIQFLGINTWNSMELIARVGQFAEGSVFVDGFYSRSTKESVQNFIQNYKFTFNVEPLAIDANAYDAAKVLRDVLAKNSLLSRDDLRARIAELNNFPGISGPISARGQKFSKAVHLLTLKGGKIEEIAF